MAISASVPTMSLESPGYPQMDKKRTFLWHIFADDGCDIGVIFDDLAILSDRINFIVESQDHPTYDSITGSGSVYAIVGVSEIWMEYHTWTASSAGWYRGFTGQVVCRPKAGKTLKGDLQTIFRFSYLKVYKLITLGTKFKNLYIITRRRNYNVFKIHNKLH